MCISRDALASAFTVQLQTLKTTLDLLAVFQIKDVNRGAFGVVVLAEDRHSGEEVAIKFIKRGSKVFCNFLIHGYRVS